MGESREHCYRMSLLTLVEDRGNWIEEIEHPFATLTSPMCAPGSERWISIDVSSLFWEPLFPSDTLTLHSRSRRYKAIGGKTRSHPVLHGTQPVTRVVAATAVPRRRFARYVRR